MTSVRWQQVILPHARKILLDIFAARKIGVLRARKHQIVCVRQDNLSPSHLLAGSVQYQYKFYANLMKLNCE